MEKIVTDLDKLLDDFEFEDSKSANENLNSDIYDVSGYISYRASDVLTNDEATEEKNDSVALKYDVKVLHEISTPTRSNDNIIDENNSNMYNVAHDENTKGLFDHNINTYHNINTDHIFNNNPSLVGSDKEDTSNFITIDKDSNNFNEEMDTFVNYDLPKKNPRPNTLLGLSCVVPTNLGNDHEDIVAEESNVIQVQYQHQDKNISNISESNKRNDVDAEMNVAVLVTFDNEGLENSVTIQKNESNDEILNESELWQGIPVKELGIREPMWITDDTSLNCMECQMSFTMFRRRHHCRACGRLLCNKCCLWRIELRCSNKLFQKDRVCVVCHQYLIKNETVRKQYGHIKTSNILFHNDNKMSDKSSLSHHLSEQFLNEIVSSPNETSVTSKSITFDDGIRPGGDFSESTHRIISPTIFQSHSQSLDVTSRKPTSREPSLIEKKEFLMTAVLDTSEAYKTNKYKIFAITTNLQIHLQLIQLPHCTCSLKYGVDITICHKCDCESVDCWFFFSVGFETIGIEEIVFVLKKLPDEDIPPTEIFQYYFQVYNKAFKNETKFDNMDMSIHLFEDNNKNLNDWVGILHFRPSFQYFGKLPLLPSTFLIGILIHKMELIWGMLLPLRLILALGNQSRFYPCSIISDRKRPLVYGKVGQTIIQNLSPTLISSYLDEKDLSFSSIISTVPGMWLHLLPNHETIIQLPKQSYSNLLNILSSWKSKRIPLALASTFSMEADSHLVCCQDIETGKYSSGAISIQNTEPHVTGATMILLIPCKNSEEHGTAIVEDIIVVKLSPKQLGYIVNSLKTMTDILLECGASKESFLVNDAISISPSMNKSIIKIVWTKSRQMCDMASVKRPSLVTHETIQKALGYLPHDDRKIIKSHRVPSSLQNILSEKENLNFTNLKLVWTRYHMVEIENTLNDDPVDFEDIIHEIACNFAISIFQFLDILYEIKLVNIGLRTTIGTDSVDWLAVGSKSQFTFVSDKIHDIHSQINYFEDADCKNNSNFNDNYEPLPKVCLEYLKEVMVPFLYSKTAFVRNGSLVSELEFHIIK